MGKEGRSMVGHDALSTWWMGAIGAKDGRSALQSQPMPGFTSGLHWCWILLELGI